MAKTAMAGKQNATHSRKRKPRLGQNFLLDVGAAQRIVEALGDVSNRTVIEIGPGRGVLTDLLLRRARRVIGIELDRVLAAQLRMRYATKGNVEILESDFVSAEFASMMGRRPGPLHDLRPTRPETVDVIGNLPYYITSDIVLRILDLHQHIERAVIMVQKEVADRIAASPGSREYGLFSATVQLFARVEKLFTLPPAAFFPQPEVHSTVIRLTIAPRLEELQVEKQPFLTFLKLAFVQKRKTLANNLRGHYQADAIHAALKVAGLRADVRAEAMSLGKAAAVFRALQPSSRPSARCARSGQAPASRIGDSEPSKRRKLSL
ncbi:MAG TPA: 16S rRNA (adenine(1518)-N(6)/adenine(1519)-N(6))-dimethyltransferase RsmA [Terriglobales bacterium]|nr:16S rRNA (adenine(1518)-N(6)/adenine(1519)-N(6))-dimethyltransferase RsmA [Terriglobales bacterium]